MLITLPKYVDCPPYKRMKYVNDDLRDRARKRYYIALRSWDDYKYLWS
jgi:hypothetical protein